MRALLLAGAASALPAAVQAQTGYRVGTQAATSADFNYFPSAAYNSNTNGGIFSNQYQTVVPPDPPSVASGDIATLTSSYAPSPTFAVNGVEMVTFDPARPVGSATNAYASSTISDTRGDAATAWASVDLASGSIHAVADTNRVGNCANEQSCAGGTAGAYFQDGLHFTVAGANAATVTSVGVTFSLDGTHAGDDGTSSLSWLMGGYFGDAVFAPFRSYYGLSASGSPFTVTDAGQTQSSWASFSFASATPDRVVFTGIYNLIGATVDLGIGLNFQVSASSGGMLDYGDTAGVSLALPSNVSYTSNSNMFLTAPAGPSVPSVPEPATWAIMLMGFALCGVALRARQIRVGDRLMAG